MPLYCLSRRVDGLLHRGRSRGVRRLKPSPTRGGGITVLHWAVGAKEDRYIEFAQRLWGGVHGGADRKYTVGKLRLTPNSIHPITAGLKPFEMRDEWYHTLKFANTGTLTPLMTVPIDGEEKVVSWAWSRPDGGRSFGFVGLHFHDNWGEKRYRQFVTRGVLWTARRTVSDRPLALTVEEEDLSRPRPKPAQ